jgi:hypothetical protein
MKALGIVALSFLSGLLGGVLSHRLTSAPTSTTPISTPVWKPSDIHFADSDSSMDLTSEGLHIRLKDGREVRLNPREGLQIQSPRHHIQVSIVDAGSAGPAPAPQPDAAYVLLDTKLWHAPPTSKEMDLYLYLIGTGEITREQLEAHRR